VYKPWSDELKKFCCLGQREDDTLNGKRRGRVRLLKMNMTQHRKDQIPGFDGYLAFFAIIVCLREK
jgi:hypothetical protein